LLICGLGIDDPKFMSKSKTHLHTRTDPWLEFWQDQLHSPSAPHLHNVPYWYIVVQEAVASIKQSEQKCKSLALEPCQTLSLQSFPCSLKYLKRVGLIERNNPMGYKEACRNGMSARGLPCYLSINNPKVDRKFYFVRCR